MVKLKRNELLSARYDAPHVEAWNPDEDVRTDVLQDDGKTLVKEIHRQTSDPYKVRQSKATDFSLQNLAAVGAVDSLRPSYLQSDNLFMNAQTLESLDNLSAYYDKIEASKASQVSESTVVSNEES